MQIFTFFSPDFKENFISKEFVLLYSPFRLKYDHFFIGQTPVEEGYDLVITKDKVKINDQKVIIIEDYNQNEIEKSVLIYKKFKTHLFTCNLEENSILINGDLMDLDMLITNSEPTSISKQPSNSEISSDSLFLNYPILNLITTPSPTKPTNNSSLSDLVKSKIKEILSEDTQVENIFRKLKMINRIN